MNPTAISRAQIAAVDKAKPEMLTTETLWDNFNRHHNYLRISLTERCNLRQRKKTVFIVSRMTFL